jgi:hypothetical protein
MSRRTALLIAAIALAFFLAGCRQPLPSFDAAREPDRAAWILFADVNRPVRHGESRWETWALPDQLFPPRDGRPQWPAQTPPKQFEQLLQQLELDKILAHAGLQVPEDFNREAVPRNSEVHLNCETFAFVVSNGLWHIQGQKDFLRNVAAGRSDPVNFPPESIAVKAVWRKLDSEEDRRKFHVTRLPDGTDRALIGFHLTSKVLPKWLWATWEHVEVEHRGRKDKFGFPDDAGPPSEELRRLFRLAGLGPEWSNYRLVGSQTDFTDTVGTPTVLGNAVIEKNILPISSCVTCHSLSAKDPYGVPLDLSAETGAPKPEWFTKDGSQYYQFDFLWSVTRRANLMLSKPEAVIPPSCSKLP